MNIFLAHDRENAAIASCWEYYFRSCGIWVDRKKYKEDLEIPRGYRGLAIISSKKLRRHLEGGASEYACFLTDERIFVRENIIARNDDKYYESIIRNLFEEYSVCQVFIELFQIFRKHHLWTASWLYEEFANADIRRWDEEIVRACKKGLRSIEEAFPVHTYREDKYIAYMGFYYRYILCGTENRTLSMRLLKCRELLDDFMPVLGQYGKEAMFQHLAGRICELSCVENKQAIFFYQKAVKYLQCSEFLYDIGHSAEKVYRNDELALSFYRRACKMDGDNYKALYKLAVGNEIQKEWADAFYIYGIMERKLGKAVKKNFEKGSMVSHREIEYLYKACKRLYYIYRQVFGCGSDENNYSTKLKKITDKYLSAQSFKELEVFMGEPGKGEEITEEINNKFKGTCYQ
ncbi:MAG: hypothetical protein NC489_46710 [Ruminococcus flavefaciens]|nr:hypothetical protein [Ruminococcus flavefaciens]